MAWKDSVRQFIGSITYCSNPKTLDARMRGLSLIVVGILIFLAAVFGFGGLKTMLAVIGLLAIGCSGLAVLFGIVIFISGEFP